MAAQRGVADEPGKRPFRVAAAEARARTAFVVRHDELAHVTAWLRDPHPGGAHLLVVEGEAGIGKTRLVDEALAAQPALPRLRATADRADRERPFGVLRALVPGGAGATSPGPAGVGGRDALVAALVARAGDAGLVVVVEDVQDVDPGTVAVLADLADPLPGRDVRVLVTARPGGADQLLARTAGHAPTDALPLGALIDDEVVALASAHLRRPVGASVIAELARTGGNPLYVTELLDALSEQGALVAATGRPAAPVELERSSLPPSLRATLLRRLRGLPSEAQEALRAASLLGGAFAVDELALALDETVPHTVARLREPLSVGWLTGTERLRFRHDLVREALHDDVPLAIRRSIHRHLAERLREVDADPARIVHHLRRGATAPDLSAAAWLHAAGRDAASHDPGLAVELLQAALDLVPVATLDHDRLVVDLAAARCWAGQVTAGEAELRQLLAGPHDPGVDADATLALARSLILSGGTEEAHQRLEAAIARCDDPLRRGRLTAELALCAMLRGELEVAASAVERVRGSGDVDEESRCLVESVRCALLALDARFGEAIAVGRDAVQRAALAADREAVRRPPQLFLGSVLLDADDFDEAWRTLDEGRRLSESLGAVWDLPLVHLVAARGRYLTGALDDALAEVETALTLAEEVGTHVLEVWAHAIAAHVHLHRLDLAPVQASLAAGEAVVSRVGVQVRGTDWLVWARARLAALEGDLALARQLLTAVWDGHRQLRMRSELRLFAPDLARWQVADGAPQAAAGTLEALDDLARIAGTTSAVAAATHARGLVAEDPQQLVAAATATRDGPCRLEHVGHAHDAAVVLAASGDRAAAADWFEQARTVARACGMVRAERAAEAELRALGVRRGVRGRRDRDVTGWDALTPTERVVVDLAASGLSNPEIGAQLYISRRTVQTHLSHVYAKLQVASRVELAALVARRAPSGPEPAGEVTTATPDPASPPDLLAPGAPPPG